MKKLIATHHFFGRVRGRVSGVDAVKPFWMA
jgi:hypothetical protein